jgi:hypothetical protein
MDPDKLILVVSVFQNNWFANAAKGTLWSDSAPCLSQSVPSKFRVMFVSHMLFYMSQCSILYRVFDDVNLLYYPECWLMLNLLYYQKCCLMLERRIPVMQLRSIETANSINAAIIAAIFLGWLWRTTFRVIMNKACCSSVVVHHRPT